MIDMIKETSRNYKMLHTTLMFNYSLTDFDID